MIKIKYSLLKSEAEKYWFWSHKNTIFRVPNTIAQEGAGSEYRTPLMHYGTVMPVYLSIIRYINTVRPKKGSKLVELGCGTGRALSFLKNCFPNLEIWGVDYSKDVIKYARKNYSKFGIKFKHRSAIKTDFSNNSFDFVISSHLIEHLNKIEGQKLIREIFRLLKKGGYCFIGTPERRGCQDLYMVNKNDDYRFRLIPPHLHEYTLEELKNIALKVFGNNHVRIDKLNNPLFNKIFHSTIKKIKPGNNRNKIMNNIYVFFRDFLSRTMFDLIILIGISINMKMQGITFRDILFSNYIKKENTKKIADNLLLVCRR